MSDEATIPPHLRLRARGARYERARPDELPGRVAELLAQGGIYARLYGMQAVSRSA